MLMSKRSKSMFKTLAIILWVVGTLVLLGCLIKQDETYTPTEVKAIIIDSYKLGAEAGIVYCINHTKESI